MWLGFKMLLSLTNGTVANKKLDKIFVIILVGPMLILCGFINCY
jgi:hypothetical protein